MENDHWFDTLNKAMVRVAPRRSLLGAAGALVASLAPGAALLTEAAKNRKKKKGKGKKKKGKPNPKRVPACSRGRCAAVPEWTGDETQINHCEFICQQCDEDDPRDFCIVSTGGGPVADCCEIEETCCGNRCCPNNAYCCDLGAGRGRHCVGEAAACCPDDFATGICDFATQKCCPGFGCVFRTESCPDGACGEQCTERGLQCCRGACHDTQFDPDHCGQCQRECRGFTNRCCNGDCFNLHSDPNHCGGCNRPCTGAGLRCCDGDCVDPLTDPDHCGNCNRDCGGPAVLCCDGDCFNSRTDVRNCGECGKECVGNEHCIEGECDCPPGQVYWQCPGDDSDQVCATDQSYLCCDGFTCGVGETDPADWVCCGRGTDPVIACVRSHHACPGLGPPDRYPPHATRRYGDE